MVPHSSAVDRAYSEPCREDAPRRSPPRLPGSRGTLGAFALALAAAASACTENHVVLEPARDAGPGLTVSAISTGNGHTCAITTTHALYCWGKNDKGQLGVGDVKQHSLPVHVGLDDDWLAVATGEGSTLALKVNGEIWAFGDNDCGQLGLGDFSPKQTPRQIPQGAVWTNIALRFQHACALKSDQSLWCWGMNQEGQLGQGDKYVDHPIAGCDATTNRVPEPQQVTTSRDVEFRAVDVGQGHTCAITSGGTLWCWGRNTDFELGQETPPQVRAPIQVGKATDWTMIQSGQSTTCGVHQDGVVYCWGASAGETDDPAGGIPGVTSQTMVSMPKAIDGLPVVTELSFNTFGGAVLGGSNDAWLWGRNLEGQLGLENMDVHPGVVRAERSGWTQVSAGRLTTCGILGGEPVCTGMNEDGELGQGTTLNSDTFLVVTIRAP